MTKENKSRLIKFLWNLASAVLAAIGTALGVSCAVAQIEAQAPLSPGRATYDNSCLKVFTKAIIIL